MLVSATKACTPSDTRKTRNMVLIPDVPLKLGKWKIWICCFQCPTVIVMFEFRFHMPVRSSNLMIRLCCTGYMSCPGDREQGHHFSQRLLVLHLWVTCRHLSIEHDAASAQHTTQKTFVVPGSVKATAQTKQTKTIQ